MELLLTPVVNRILSKFIKKLDDGTPGSQLRARLSGGSFVLHDLELNLDSLLGGLPIDVHRAFAKELRLNIVWTALASHPIQVELESVEIIIKLNDAKRLSADRARVGQDGGASWLGSVTSILLRALFDTSLLVRNLVVKAVLPDCVAELTIGEICLQSITDGWQRHLKRPDSWLKKCLKLKEVNVDIQPIETGVPPMKQPNTSPLLRLPALDVTALTPIFAIIEDHQNIGQPLVCHVDVDVGNLKAHVAPYQVPLLASLAAKAKSLQTSRPNGVGKVSLAPAADGNQNFQASDDEWRRLKRAAELNGGMPAAGADGQTSGGWFSSFATGVGSAWSYITDEAAAVDIHAPPPSVPRPKTTVKLNFNLIGGCIALGTSKEQTSDGRDTTDQMWANLSWADFCGNLHHNGDEFVAADLAIGQVNALRQVLGAVGGLAGEVDEVLGIYPCEEVESSMLTRPSDAPCAARLIWQKGQAHVDGSLPKSENSRVSVTIGRFSTSYPAGLATDLNLFLGRNEVSGGTLPVIQNNSNKPDVEGANASSPRKQLPNILSSPVDLDFAILSLQACLLSARESRTEAVCVSVHRLSAHLGILKPASRPGSVSAALQTLANPSSSPTRGFRISVIGLEIGICTRWEPAPQRRQSNLPNHAQVVCHPMECQAALVPVKAGLLGESSHIPAVEKYVSHVPDNARLFLAVGMMEFNLTLMEIAALRSVAEGLRAEADRKLKTKLPSRGETEPLLADDLDLMSLRFHFPHLALVWSLDNAALVCPTQHFLAGVPVRGVGCIFGVPAASIVMDLQRESVVHSLCLDLNGVTVQCLPGVELSIPKLTAGLKLLKRDTQASEDQQSSEPPWLPSPVALLSRATSPGAASAGEPDPAGRQSFACLTSIRLVLGKVDKQAEALSQGASLQLPPDGASKQGTQAQLILQEVALDLDNQLWRDVLQTCVYLKPVLRLPSLPCYPCKDSAGGQRKEIAIDLGTLHVAVQLDPSQAGMGKSDFVLEAKGVSALLETKDGGQSTLRDEEVQLPVPGSRQMLSIVVAGISLTHQNEVVLSLQPCPGHVDALDLTLRKWPTADDAATQQVSLSCSFVELHLSPQQVSSFRDLVLKSSTIVKDVRAVQTRTAEEHCTDANHRLVQSTVNSKLSLQADVAGGLLRFSSKTKNDCRLCLQVDLAHAAVVVYDAEPAFPGFPSPIITNGSVQGFTLAVTGPGSLRAVKLIDPTDASISGSRVRGSPSHTSFMLTLPDLRALITPATAYMIQELSLDFKRAFTSADGPKVSSQGQVQVDKLNDPKDHPLRLGEPEASQESKHAPEDDLRCGLFELTPLLGTRPDPLQIGFGDKQPGALSWTGIGESWICWSYAYPREVKSILITLPPELVRASELEVLGYSEAEDDFTNLEMEIQSYRSLATGDIDCVLVIVKESAAFQEWQICWECPTDFPTFNASYMLRHLYVNPGLGETRLAQVVVPLTLGLSIGNFECQIDSDLPGKLSAYQVGTVQLSQCKVAWHFWKQSRALRMKAGLDLTCVDNVSLSQEGLLACKSVSLNLASGPGFQPQQQQNTSNPDVWDPSENVCSPVPCPQKPGTHLTLRFAEGPLVFRASELGYQTMLQNFNLMETSILAAKSLTSKADAGEVKQEFRAIGVELENRCGSHLMISQLGVEEWLQITDGATLQYTWQALPSAERNIRRLLCLRAFHSSLKEERQPDGGETLVDDSALGSGSSLLGKAHRQDQTQPDWKAGVPSSVFDAMTQGSSLRQAEFEDGQLVLITVHCSQQDSGWKVILMPGCRISNQTSCGLTFSLVAPRLSEPLGKLKSSTPGDALRDVDSQEQKVLFVDAGNGKGMAEVEVPVLKAHGGACSPAQISCLRIWLGRGSGWSNPLPLHGTGVQVKDVRPAGFEGKLPITPTQAATHDSPGSIIAVLKPSDSGLLLTVWPSILVSSDLPLPVRWRMQASDFSADSLGLKASKIAQTHLGLDVPLHCFRGAPTNLSLSLGDKVHRADSESKIWSEDFFINSGGSNGQRWGSLQGSSRALPAPGQAVMVQIPCKGSSLQALLLSEAQTQEKPYTHLRLVPSCCIQNCTDMTIALSFLDGPFIEVKPLENGMGDLKGSKTSLHQASLSLHLNGSTYISKAFDLETGDLTLCLNENLSGTSAEAQARSAGMLLLAVRVDWRRYPSVGPSAAESLILTVTPGLVCTNLMTHSLTLRPVDAIKDTGAAVKVEPEQTVNLPWVWQTAVPTKASVQRRSSDRRSSDGLDRRIGMHVGVFDPGGQEGVYVDLNNTHTRQRLYICHEGNTEFVTCRVVLKHGRFQAVLFQDRQPPFAFYNKSDSVLEVGYFLPEANKVGEIQYETASRILLLQPDRQQDFELRDDAELGAQYAEEDEDAFLDRMTQTDKLEVPYLGKLRMRSSPTACWSDLCPVECGRFYIDDLEVSIFKACASLHCVVSPLRPSEVEPLLSAMPRSISIEIETLQISLMEDERLRWLGLSEIPVTASELAKLPAELLCVQISHLKMNASQFLTGGGRDQCFSGSLSANGLEVASFLPGSSQTFLCSSVPTRLSKQNKHYSALHIEAIAEHSLLHNGANMSFRNTWLQKLVLRAPTLAVSVDDAILQLIEQVSRLNSRAAQLTSPVQSAQPHVVREKSQRSASLLSPATKPPMIDLSALDNLEISSRQGSPFWGGSLTPASPSMPLPWATTSYSDDEVAVSKPGMEVNNETLDDLDLELYTEALAASASRLMLKDFNVGRVSLLVDLHISEASKFAPFALDTHGTPLSLPQIGAKNLLFRPSVILQGLLAHYAAEALLNAPAVLGSLELLLNPTGLVQSVGQGFEDLISLPMAALQSGSPAQFIAGLGLGSASLLRQFSGWTLTSISGFSSAFSRVLQKTLSAQGASSSGGVSRRQRDSIAGGLQGLAQGVSSGLTGIYRSPVAGYGSGSSSGLAVGMGRGLLGAVGLPLSGALDLVSSVSAGIASSTGITHASKSGRSGLLLGDESAVPSGARLRMICSLMADHQRKQSIIRTVSVEIKGPGTLEGRHSGVHLVVADNHVFLVDAKATKVLLKASLQDWKQDEDQQGMFETANASSRAFRLETGAMELRRILGTDKDPAASQ